ncbi:hypothetical protein GUJ93_ZPchr0006g44764 [Zizania palustris]|uniref:Protein kinase domain-containing protein n=1 Tax=Zizania palustris TaxID=103762 RepID=A0A8J5SST2_ZIZPA|nr:hypothetical protein GUJ93_ZPchr0006g44764 [Zizania palustris]
MPIKVTARLRQCAARLGRPSAVPHAAFHYAVTPPHRCVSPLETTRKAKGKRSGGTALKMSHGAVTLLSPALHVLLPRASRRANRQLQLKFYCISDPVERAFFYRLGADDVNAVLSRLADSLSLALQAFYPVAGRLRLTPGKTNRYELFYQPGDGVAFTVAEHDGIDVDELAAGHPREAEKLSQFVPKLPEGGAMFAVQATVPLPSCRGLALGVTVTHVACDGASSTHFLHTWAAACAGVATPPPPPPFIVSRAFIHERERTYTTLLPVDCRTNKRDPPPLFHRSAQDRQESQLPGCAVRQESAVRRARVRCPPPPRSAEVRQESAVAAPQRFGTVALSDVRFVRRLGSGDIGSVYLAEVKGKGGDGGGSGSGGVAALVAAKVMDRKELAGRNKEGRARTEREILEAVDHPFLPRLYGVAEGDRWSCLLTEFCPGGDLHVLRQRQPHRRFSEAAVRKEKGKLPFWGRMD